MEVKLPRGQVVLAPDPYKSSGYRPFVIVSDETYPFYPTGYLGLPVTTRDKSNTFQIMHSDIVETTEPLDVWPSYVNPYSPAQVNEMEKKIVRLSDNFMDMLAQCTARAAGLGEV